MAANPSNDSPPLDVLRLIDQACVRFEAAWRSPTPPRVEDFLSGLAEPTRARLFGELLLIEAELRGGIDAAGYRERFPEYVEMVDDVVAGRTADFRPPAGTPAGYEIVRELGKGGMGVVYLARQTRAGRLVALKIIRDDIEASPEGRRRFLTEAVLASRLSHPNIVPIYEAGEHHGCPFLAMEYVAGGSLQARLAGKPQAPEEAAALVECLARAMHAAHEAGVLHRDLKPANVLLGRGRRGPLLYEPKVTDFGLARDLSADAVRHTRTGQVMGTPSYMSPEQAEGKKDVGPLADVYGLGVILYECLTGRPPLRGATPLETMGQVRSQEPAPPRLVRAAVPDDLDKITLKCLRKEPARRYASAAALADDLRAFLDRRPVRAAAAAPPGPARGAVVLALVVLPLLAGLPLAVWGWRQADRATRMAEEAHRAERRGRTAERRQARLALHHGLLLCKDKEVGHGLLWLVEGLRAAHAAGDADLEKAARSQLIQWAGTFRPAVGPPPALTAGTPVLVRLAVEVHTGLTFDENHVVRPLRDAEMAELRQQLEELEAAGPPAGVR